MTRIRPARPDGDAAAVAELTTQLGYPVTESEARSRVAAVTQDGGAVLVACDGADRAIGWIQVGAVTTLEVGVQAVIHGLVVDEEHRGGGIGQALLEAGEAWAREAGIGLMLVRSRETRERAHRFYERSGYEHSKTSRVFRKPL
ncbi:MAG TPA: GNAT family N-acetyltransferase [Candidatus Limnocylindria bacterium]|jgi:GNAT superfamily N-acetyltransferase|nr:GNAT family N-acetyltransferase [Candidatus Limnocylindria bacterium]